MTSPVRDALELSKQQFHILTTADAQELGLSRWTLKRLVDVGHWQRLFYGIYLTHSAKPNWVSRAQAALLMGGENSFLSHESARSEEHTSELQSRGHLVCRLLL